MKMKCTCEISTLINTVTIVAVEGAVGDWAAYMGVTQGIVSHEYRVSNARKYGTKIPYNVAAVIFPNFDDIFSWRE